MDKLYTIIRFEEDYAVTTTEGRTVNIPFEEIPEDSQPGDKLAYVDGSYVKA
ncbi:MAG: DUF3006 domain-containing protein [Sphaerochaetaceae bacterium]|jgi:hypothetical protein